MNRTIFRYELRIVLTRYLEELDRFDEGRCRTSILTTLERELQVSRSRAGELFRRACAPYGDAPAIITRLPSRLSRRWKGRFFLLKEADKIDRKGRGARRERCWRSDWSSRENDTLLKNTVQGILKELGDELVEANEVKEHLQNVLSVNARQAWNLIERAIMRGWIHDHFKNPNGTTSTVAT